MVFIAKPHLQGGVGGSGSLCRPLILAERGTLGFMFREKQGNPKP